LLYETNKLKHIWSLDIILGVHANETCDGCDEDTVLLGSVEVLVDILQNAILEKCTVWHLREKLGILQVLQVS